MSVQVTPLPVKPAWQAHVREPVVLVQVALALQPPLFVRHSLMSTHVEPDLAKPIVQVIPHAPAEQVEAPFAVEGHAVHDVPHDDGEVSETHCCPHACWPAGHWHMPPVEQVAPVGQSAMRRQPSMHRRESGSQ